MDLWMEKPLVLDVSKCGPFFLLKPGKQVKLFEEKVEITDKFWWKKDHVGATNLDNQL